MTPPPSLPPGYCFVHVREYLRGSSCVIYIGFPFSLILYCFVILVTLQLTPLSGTDTFFPLCTVSELPLVPRAFDRLLMHLEHRRSYPPNLCCIFFPYGGILHDPASFGCR